MGSNSLIQHSNGVSAELFVASWMAAQGWGILWPMAAQSRYDLVCDIDGELSRVQVKKATWSKSGNHSYLQARLSGKNKLTNTPYKNGDVDAFAFTDMETIWIAPPDELIGLTSVCLSSSNPNYKPKTDYIAKGWIVNG